VIVDHFEKAKKSDLVLVHLVVQVINVSADGADRLCATHGKKELVLGVLPERVLLWIEELEPISIDRRHPIWIVVVDAPREFDKLLALYLARDWDDANVACCHR
jgi:hypothetical protein